MTCFILFTIPIILFIIPFINILLIITPIILFITDFFKNIWLKIWKNPTIPWCQILENLEPNPCVSAINQGI